jgi:hypothetical protein
MKVLADFHHEHLYESLRILIEDRLGWELYRPIGLEWYHEKYWNIYPHISTAEQYLSLNTGKEYRKLEKGERIGGDRLRSDSGEILRYANWNPTETSTGIYEVSSPVFPKKYKAITLEAFQNTKFDILLASMPEHVEPYKKLQKLFQPYAKLVFQAGNNWPVPSGIPNILTSALMNVPANINSVYYHQEFDLSLFSFKKPEKINRIYNMMHYIQDDSTFLALEKGLPDWEFKAYGAGNRDKSRGPDAKDIAKAFHEMGFLWHVKKEGDGYGYNIHHAAATGTPLIVRKSHFRNMTADPLLINEETCIDLDQYSIAETIQILKNLDYKTYSNNIYNKFKAMVNFDQEFENIKTFFYRLQ